MKKNHFFLLAVTLLLNVALHFNVQANQSQEAQQTTSKLDSEVRTALPNAQLAGRGKLNFFGLEVYDASLWTAEGFKADNFDSQAFALDLHYHRGFSAEAIAKRSLKEMNRIEPIPDQLAQQWLTELQDALPNIKKGDHLVGVHQPGKGVYFWHNGMRKGEIKDADFSRQFFAIWLSPKTPEPKLRMALLGKTKATP